VQIGFTVDLNLTSEKMKHDPEKAGSRSISNHILPSAATMTGVCVTIISIVRLVETNHHVSTIIDNIMAVNSLIFLISCFLSYMSLRSYRTAGTFERYADILFLTGLSVMVIGGFFLAWEFEHF
jgi:hypothetical protein